MNHFKPLCLTSLLCLSTIAAHDTNLYGPVLPLEHVENSIGAVAMVSTGDYLYTAANGRLAIYNIKDNPLKPRLVRIVTGFQGGRQMVRHGDYLFLTARNFGLWIIDIHDRENPTILPRFDSTELATGVAVSGNICFIAHRVYGVQLLDITDPLHPRHISTIRTQEAQTVFVQDHYAFMGDWGSGYITIADVADPLKPQVISRTKLDGYGDGLDLAGDLCVASTGHHSFKNGGAKTPEGFGHGHGVEVIDISNPHSPQTLSVFKFPQLYHLGNDFWTVRICDNYAFAADTFNGFFALDITDRTAPKPLGHALLPEALRYDPKTQTKTPGSDCATSVALGDGCVYVTGSSTGLFVVPMPGKSHFVQSKSQPLVAPKVVPDAVIPRFKTIDISDHVQVRRAAYYKDDIAFFACSHAGIKICKISADDIAVIGTQPMACAYDVTVHGDRLYAAEGPDGIGIYDILPDYSLREAARYTHPSRADFPQILHVYMNGRVIAWHGRGGKLSFLDVSNLAAPKNVFNFNRIGILYNDNLADRDINGIVPCNFGHGQGWFDLNGPIPKVLVTPTDTFRIDHNNNAFAAFNGKFISADFKKLDIFDPKTVTTDEKPVAIPLGTSEVRGQPTIDGNIVTFVCRSKGDITTFDISDLENPKLVEDRTWRNLPCIPDRAIFWRHRLVIPAGPAGVLLESK